jgi:hypothetical protein
MGTSFLNQIPHVVGVVQQLRPTRILDIGKGFGKYGMLFHEYIGLDTESRIDPSKSVRCQSRIRVDAVEPDPDLMLPHLDHYYATVYHDRIEDVYRQLSGYDLVLMADVIEHLDKAAGETILRHFVQSSAVVVISTPIYFFSQSLYKSKFEEHRSFWAIRDFRRFGHVIRQRIGDGGIYVVSRSRLHLRGFGDGLFQKGRRIARAIRDEGFWW